MGWLRRLLGAPMRPGDSFRNEDGSTLTYLGKEPDPWDDPTCRVCGEPATDFKTLPPWPGSTYCHTSMTCAAHISYLDGKMWGRGDDGEWQEHESESLCATCGGPYGQCQHTAGYAAMIRAQEAGAVRGKIASR